MEITLLKCQEEAINAFVLKGGRMGLQASVGSGKTFVAAGCIKRSQDKYPLPALYLTTKTSAIEQEKKLRDFGLKAYLITGEPFVPEDNETYIMTPDRMVRDFDFMQDIEWGIIVVDEADQYTGSASKRNKCLIRLKARHKLMMSGSWLRNGLKDCFFPLAFLPQVPLYRNWTEFNDRELLHKNPTLPHMITGIRDEYHLASLLRPFMYEMINKDAPKELTATTVIVTLSPEEREVYEKMKDELIWEAEDGTLTISNQAVLNLRLRQLVAMPEALGIKLESSKVKKLTELVSSLEGKTAVFTSFATVAKLLSERFKWSVLHGGMTTKERVAVLAEEPEVIVMTSAGERGVDMPWLSNIVSMDVGFTPATLRQRAGRATRYGRTGEAKMYLLQAQHTVDVTSEARIVLRKLKEARRV